MRRFLLVFLFFAAAPLAGGAAAASKKSCVWKVTGPAGTLYLAGSVHALRASDYPLQAFTASSELVFETDPYASADAWERRLDRASRLPDGVMLKDKVDPRTYAYILRVLGRSKGAKAPEQKIAHLRPWALSWMLETPGKTLNASRSQGVESYLQDKARKARKRMSGLVSLDQHIAVFGGMSDEDSEVLLLLQFIHLDAVSKEYQRTLDAWKRGDDRTIHTLTRGDYGESPARYRRIIADRNRAWLPKIEGFLRAGGRPRMVVAGAAHMAGEDGLVALLRARGYQVEQL